ncbi:penicillin-binding protein 1A [Sphaerotilus sp.]|uniref:penicillin-binding protein 1A n=1 Tax=Sphaerotilus sp. TaxID=2093942 RepID=UPI002ACD4F3F|nr:penicillin-binding protein 1A [Sphaerotilus sp.]MDZ7856683.1 penicillin-binding protein 1A [Sphaerotilus sp.]
MRPRPGLRLLAWIIGLPLALVMAFLLLLGLALTVAYPNLPELSGLVDYRPKLPMRVVSADGVVLSEFGEERRNYLPIKSIPMVMQEAVLAIEDARFYQHGGIDYKGILRAGIENLQDARSQGASTITMQVARNFYLSTEKTLTRKVYEVLLALKIESQLSKEKILEVYMNQIYLGQRAYGFAAASEIYFGKPLKDITVAEAAMLAGLPKAPSAYNPIANRKRAEIRQRHIIGRMRDNGYITEAQHDEALAETLTYRTPRSSGIHAEYAAETARQMVFAQYGDATYSRGLIVEISLRTDDQMHAYRTLRRGLLNFEARKAYRGPSAFIDLPREVVKLDARVAEALEEHPDFDDLRAAVVLSVEPKKVSAMLQNGESITVTGDGLRQARASLAANVAPKMQIHRGAVVRVMKSAKGDWSIVNLPEVEGALVSMDPQTGEIRAMVGGFDYAKSKFNHVTQAWRQPGSSFKPFIYSAAMEKGFSPATVVNDAPLFFDAGVTGSQPWEPKNYDGQFDGPMSIRRGLAKSKNMVSIRLLKAIGPGYAQQWVTRFGFEAEKNPPYLTMALGAGAVTPMSMAGGYAVLANGGVRVNPVLITRITDSRGHLIAEAPPQNGQDERMRAIPARNAFITSSLLQEVTRTGTAARAQAVLKRPDLYGKTGTTNDSQDAWFGGYNKGLVAIVWIGYDTPRSLGDKETGGGLALPVWIDYMGQALRNVPVSEYSAPDGVTQVGNEWYYTENSQGGGVRSLGLEDVVPRPAAEERQGILDLFRDTDGVPSPSPEPGVPTRPAPPASTSGPTEPAQR